MRDPALAFPHSVGKAACSPSPLHDLMSQVSSGGMRNTASRDLPPVACRQTALRGVPGGTFYLQSEDLTDTHTPEVDIPPPPTQTYTTLPGTCSSSRYSCRDNVGFQKERPLKNQGSPAWPLFFFVSFSAIQACGGRAVCNSSKKWVSFSFTDGETGVQMAEATGWY